MRVLRINMIPYMGGATNRYMSQGKTSAAGGSSYLPCWLADSRNYDVNDAGSEDLVVKLDIDLEIGPQLTLPTKSLETCRRGCTRERRAGIWNPFCDKSTQWGRW